ncbi:capsular biosynthesis protein [Desulfomicrobium sp. ZS1]|uniref:capsule biosynthesis protein n=1 Tax=Desulfomicrobium sp. ZS1 TaxID=2952228 RepID=UPI0020B3663C|nr:capsular biosynthesis protein [Desulfomicrobium sp. ZS1]UTF51195.1 capsular biosynthesis protein [Desulfomicrobium sp. ZS1]
MTLASTKRTFLFLQGPQSAFFRRLGRTLRRYGASVIKINFCGGDIAHWPGQESRLYLGGNREWSSWISRIMQEEKVTDLLLFGDWRPLHWEAVLLARHFRIRVFVFEEGYLRPDYITMEEGGVNGNSTMPTNSQAVLEAAGLFPEPLPPTSVPNPIRQRVYDAIIHHVCNGIMLPAFFRYRTHRPHNIARELCGWIPRYLGRKKREKKSQVILRNFFHHKHPYFLFPLQLDADAQVRRYSPFSGMREGIGHVIASFAAYAEQNTHLLIKNHPLDNGLIDYAGFIEDFTRACGVSERVHFVDHGNTTRMIKHSSGVVLLNSTIGLSALELGRPVYCIGKSIYAMQGLALSNIDQPLNSFWTLPIEPNKIVLDAFLKVLKVRTLVNGNFYTSLGIRTAIAHCMVRLGMVQPTCMQLTCPDEIPSSFNAEPKPIWTTP